MRLFTHAESGQITNTPLSLDTAKHSRYILSTMLYTQNKNHRHKFIMESYLQRKAHLGKAAEALKVIPKSALAYCHETSNVVFTLRQ